jgi:hypothetical protein
MSEMKLIMESWRKFEKGSDAGTLCLFENRRVRRVPFVEALNSIGNTEKELDLFLEKWEKSINYEFKRINEGWEEEARRQAAEHGEEVPRGAEDKGSILDSARKKISDFILELSIQAFSLMGKGKSAIKKVTEIVSKMLKIINKYCEKMPIVCKVAKTTAAILALFAISALFFSPEAQAAIQIGEKPLSEDAYNFLRGMLADLLQDPDIELSKKGEYINIIDQLDAIQKAPEVTKYEDLAPKLQAALDYGADQYAGISDMVDKEKLTVEQANYFIDYFTKLGDSASAAYRKIESTGGSREQFSFSAADDLGRHPFNK